MRFISWQHYGGLFSDIVSVQLDHFNANFTHSVPDNFQISRIQLLEKSMFFVVFFLSVLLIVCYFAYVYQLAKEGHGSDPYDWGLPALVCSWHHLLTGENNTLISRSIRAHPHYNNEFAYFPNHFLMGGYSTLIFYLFELVKIDFL